MACGHNIEFKELTFLNKTQECLQIECPVCLDLLTSPYLASCCGYHFCGKCNSRLAGNPCPLCNSDFHTMFDKGLQRMLNSLKVSCPRKLAGCEWDGNPSVLQEHIANECDFTVLLCPQKCGDMILRMKLEDHKKLQCCRRPAMCTYCEQSFTTFEIMESQHTPECSKYPISCINDCGMEVPRGQLDNHVNQECLLKEVNCDYEILGCKWQGLRRDMKPHVCDSLQEHADFLLKKNSSEHDTMKAAIALLEEKVSSLSEAAKSRENFISQLELRIKRLETQTLEQEKKLDEFQQVHVYEDSDEYDDSDDDGEWMRCEICGECHYKDPLSKLDCTFNLLAATFTGEAIGTNMPSHVTSTPSMHPSQLSGKKIVTNFSFLVSQFKLKQEYSTHAYSTFFYAGNPGYRFCLSVYPNGYGEAKGKYLSVFVHITKGTKDYLLKWPFRGFIIIRLKQSDNHGYHQQVVHYNDAVDDTVAGCVNVWNDISEGCGIPEFIPLEALKDTYLVGDSLLFHVPEVYIQ